MRGKREDAVSLQAHAAIAAALSPGTLTPVVPEDAQQLRAFLGLGVADHAVGGYHAHEGEAALVAQLRRHRRLCTTYAEEGRREADVIT